MKIINERQFVSTVRGVRFAITAMVGLCRTTGEKVFLTPEGKFSPADHQPPHQYDVVGRAR